ncbi:hypothetical protein F2Q68_00027973 [Brassica cretica]|uniref:Uncharacterized protein n=1 Tax=Brassica cretica TaxID=69181 RepID=A0A8S9IIW4_BRACR|nr:hypothetical protein F2Q68_00027973 [Brassica cretica]
MVEEEVEEPEEEAEEMVEDEVEEPEKETEKYTEEEKQEWYMVVYEDSTCETKKADKGTAKPSGTGVKHRSKQMALRKQAPKKAPKLRGRPRKATQPKKSTTPEQIKGYVHVHVHSGFPLLSLKLTVMRLKGARRSLEQRLRRQEA